MQKITKIALGSLVKTFSRNLFHPALVTLIMNTEVQKKHVVQEVPHAEKTALGKMKDGVLDAASALKEAVTGEGIKETTYKNEKSYRDADGNIHYEKDKVVRER